MTAPSPTPRRFGPGAALVPARIWLSTMRAMPGLIGEPPARSSITRAIEVRVAAILQDVAGRALIRCSRSTLRSSPNTVTTMMSHSGKVARGEADDLRAVNVGQSQVDEEDIGRNQQQARDRLTFPERTFSTTRVRGSRTSAAAKRSSMPGSSSTIITRTTIFASVFTCLALTFWSIVSCPIIIAPKPDPLPQESM